MWQKNNYYSIERSSRGDVQLGNISWKKKQWDNIKFVSTKKLFKHETSEWKLFTVNVHIDFGKCFPLNQMCKSKDFSTLSQSPEKFWKFPLFHWEKNWPKTETPHRFFLSVSNNIENRVVSVLIQNPICVCIVVMREKSFELIGYAFLLKKINNELDVDLTCI